MRITPWLAPLALIAATSAAFAQFPPPGAYACTVADGSAFGALFLAPDGDYQFTAADGTKGEGQMASSGTDVRALSGPLFDGHHLTGTFATGPAGDTHFSFSSDAGDISCGPG
jgi:hypothetical protein